MDERREVMSSGNPPTLEELLAFANKMQKSRDREELQRDSVEYCKKISCYLIAHVMPLGDRTLTAMPLLSALRVVTDILENAFKDENPFFVMASHALCKIVLDGSETVTVKVPVKKDE